MDPEMLRPVERRVLAMRRQGMNRAEIAGRIQRSPRHVSHILEWSQIPRDRTPGDGREGDLSPLERRVLALREEGHDHAEIGRRFRRSSRFIWQVEDLAHLRRDWSVPD